MMMQGAYSLLARRPAASALSDKTESTDDLSSLENGSSHDGSLTSPPGSDHDDIHRRTELGFGVSEAMWDEAGGSLPYSLEKPGWMDFLLEPRISQGNLSLPLQAESRPWLKYLIYVPIWMIAQMTFGFYLLSNSVGQRQANEDFWLKLVTIAGCVLFIVADVAQDVYTFVMLVRGTRRRYLPAHIPRLTHAVIVCNYKEPIEVLRATIESLANNTLASSTIVVLACEARDATASHTYDTLEAEFEGQFQNFIKTTHELAPNEIIGKSSNENYACRELYQLVQEQGLDPWEVMVTTCDADSLFDTVFLEQLEAEYCRMPDGRRFLYNSPINTYRNLPECHHLVKLFEIRRNQFDLYHGLSFRPAQSNYSLTLGFAHEINFWDPTNTSEDFHTTLRAMATTGKYLEMVVPVWSLVLNDSVTKLPDRWTQARRHMWGIEEAAFIISLFPVIRITQWISLFQLVAGQMFSVCIPPVLVWWCICPPVRNVFWLLGPEMQWLVCGMYVGSYIYDWVQVLAREFFLYKLLLERRPLMMKRTTGEWFQIAITWPFLAHFAKWVFAGMATWSVLVHAVFHDTLTYVTAPKALNLDSSRTATGSPSHSFMLLSPIDMIDTSSRMNKKPKKSV